MTNRSKHSNMRYTSVSPSDIANHIKVTNEDNKISMSNNCPWAQNAISVVIILWKWMVTSSLCICMPWLGSNECTNKHCSMDLGFSIKVEYFTTHDRMTNNLRHIFAVSFLKSIHVWMGKCRSFKIYLQKKRQKGGRCQIDFGHLNLALIYQTHMWHYP